MSATADFYQHFAERGLVPLIHEGAPPPPSTETYQCRDGSTMAVPCMTIAEARRDHQDDEHIAAFLDYFAPSAWLVARGGRWLESAPGAGFSFWVTGKEHAARFSDRQAAAACAAESAGMVVPDYD
jgi:hypothetical protein